MFPSVPGAILASVTESSANLAEATDPLAKLVAFKFVKAEPLAAGSVAGNLASGTVPEVNCVAFKAVKLLPLFATMLPLASRIVDLVAGRVQNTSLVPAPKLTALLELDDVITVVLANVSGVASVIVPKPTSKSPFEAVIA